MMPQVSKVVGLGSWGAVGGVFAFFLIQVRVAQAFETELFERSAKPNFPEGRERECDCSITKLVWFFSPCCLDSASLFLSTRQDPAFGFVKDIVSPPPEESEDN